jgi:hypothetical protein
MTGLLLTTVLYSNQIYSGDLWSEIENNAKINH